MPVSLHIKVRELWHRRAMHRILEACTTMWLSLLPVVIRASRPQRECRIETPKREQAPALQRLGLCSQLATRHSSLFYEP